MPPHIEVVESHHHHDDWNRPQQSISSGGGSACGGRIEDLSPLFRDHHDDRTFLPGAAASSSSCRLDRRVCNPNYSDGKEILDLKEGSTADNRQEHQQPSDMVVSRIAAIIGPESAYYATVCPNNKEEAVGRALAPPSISSSAVPTSKSSALIGKPCPPTPPSSPSSTSTSLSSSSASASSSCNEMVKEKKKKSIFSRLTKNVTSSWRKTTKATNNCKVVPPLKQQQFHRERNVI